MRSLLKILLVVTFAGYSWSVLATENIASKALDFVIKNQTQAMSAIGQKNNALWRAYMENTACQNTEQAQRMFPIIYNGVDEFTSAIVLRYQQKKKQQEKYVEQQDDNPAQLLPVELLTDVSNFVYYSYVFGYMKGYIYRAAVYLHFHPEIKQEFCDKADVMASAELDQFAEPNPRKYAIEIMNEYKLYSDYRAIYANTMFGQQTFQTVFHENARYFDAFIYALILNKQSQVAILRRYVMSIELKNQYFSTLLTNAQQKHSSLREKDQQSIFNNSAYQLQLHGYMLGFIRFYNSMRDEFPELNENMEQHMPKYLAETMVMLAQKTSTSALTDPDSTQVSATNDSLD